MKTSLLRRFLALLFALTCLLCVPTSAIRTFYLGGLFPVDAQDVRTRLELGLYTRTAAEMAVRDIKQMQVLSDYNYTMELVSFDSGCDEATSANGLVEMIKFLGENNEFEGRLIDAIPSFPHALLGPACNNPTIRTASLTSHYFNSLQISYAADTPQLLNVGDNPLFFRSVPSYTTYKGTIYAVMNELDWLNVGVIHEVVPYYTIALEQFVDFLTEPSTGARVVVSQGYDAHLLLTETVGARIFVGMVPENEAANMLCAAYRQELIGRRFQWILLGDYEQDWWRNPASPRRRFRKRRCSEEEMIQAVESVLILTHKLQIMSEEVVTVSGRTVQEFWSDYARFFNRSLRMQQTQRNVFDRSRAFRVPSTYDAVWSIALALNKTLSSYDESNSSSCFNKTASCEDAFTFKLKEYLEAVNFTGVSGHIQYSPLSHSQLPQSAIISQMQSGIMVPIGVHDREADAVNLSYFGNNLVWQGGSPPRDRPKITIQNVSIWLVGTILGVTVIGLLFAFILLFLNIYYRKHKVIKASSPYISMIIIVGCVFAFIAVIVMSIESIDIHQYISPSAYPFLCNVRPWLLSFGFTLAFGALFAKTWRVYVIFRNPWKKKRPYKDRNLIAMVGVFLVFDIILLTLWTSLDPLMLLQVNIDTDLESFTQDEHLICSPRNGVSSRLLIWITVISIPKVILLMFGTFLVTQTAKIKTKFFNDARYTAIAIYGVVICCLSGVPTSILSMYRFEEEWGYADATLTILACSYLILIMVFVPKLVLLRQYRTKIPTAVLLNINPTFRIPNSNRAHRLKSKRRSNSTWTTTSVDQLSDTTAYTRDEDTLTVDTNILDDWEPAMDGEESSSSSSQFDRQSVVFQEEHGGVSYMEYASYTVEDCAVSRESASTVENVTVEVNNVND